MSQEIWKPIPSLDGMLEASSEGRIRRAVANYHNTQVGKIFSQFVVNRYPAISFCHKGVNQLRHVHRLVVEAFYGPPPTKTHQVNHRDGNPMNNLVENLEWVTPKENQQHAVRVLGRRCGINNPKSIVDQATVDLIRGRYTTGEKISVIARGLGLKYSMVFDICHGRSWTYPSTRKKTDQAGNEPVPPTTT